MSYTNVLPLPKTESHNKALLLHLNITQDFVQAKYINGSEKGIKHSDLEQDQKAFEHNYLCGPNQDFLIQWLPEWERISRNH